MLGSVATLPRTALEAGEGLRPDTRTEQVQTLQTRIRRMQKRGLDDRAIPTLPGLAELLTGGGLRTGATYSVEESYALVMAMLAGPSSTGCWCGVVGLPDFGLEAAVGFGIEPARLVLVPHPGLQWLTITAALTDVLPVVVARLPARVSETDAARLAARLRQRGSTLVVVGPWPQAEARLSLGESVWSGLGPGYGRLSRREVTVTVTGAQSRPRTGRLSLPPGRAEVRGPAAASAPLRTVV